MQSRRTKIKPSMVPVIPNGPAAPHKPHNHVDQSLQHTKRNFISFFVSFNLLETTSHLLCSCQCPTSSSLNPLDVTFWPRSFWHSSSSESSSRSSSALPPTGPPTSPSPVPSSFPPTPSSNPT